LAVATSAGVNLSPQPFVLAVMYSAAASLSTPLGYPTNLMVYGPGAYKFSDFIKVGLPLNVLLMLVAVYIIPMIWPF
jgi:di/tricarboxylate transporter